MHRLIAKVWAHRLAERIVIAAGEGFIPGKVSFSVQTKTDTGANVKAIQDIARRIDKRGGELVFDSDISLHGFMAQAAFAAFLEDVGFAAQAYQSA